MKRICTKIAIFCALIIAQTSYAQSVTMNTTDPAPTPGFGPSLAVTAANGFASTATGTFNNFPKGKTTTMTSPSYYYTAGQSIVYAKFNLSVATSGSATVSPVVDIITSDPVLGTITATASTLTIAGTGGVDYYIAFTLGATLPANTNFKVAVTMNVPNNDKTIVANTFSTNAVLGSAPASLPLPVSFTGFSAKKQTSNVSLTWNVGVELNVSGYEVQRSTDGSHFTKIGFVAANGMSSYNFVDAKLSDNVYYRIKSVDLDGTYAYSTIVSLKGQQSAIVLKAFPTPVTSQLTIQHGSVNSNSKIEIMAIDGRIIKSVSVAADAQQTNIDFSSAKAGIYIARFDNGNGQTETLKIIKQ